MSLNIFISYRKDDSKWNTQILYDRLRQYFPAKNIFKDFNTIKPGADYATSIDKALQKCQVLLVVIGKGWLDAKDAQGARRLENEGDLVRIEIATALRRKIRVIPVLYDAIKMPSANELPQDLQDLALRQAVNVSEQNFDYDIKRLAEEIRNKKLQEGSPAWQTILNIRFVIPALFLCLATYLLNRVSGIVSLKLPFIIMASLTSIFVSLIVTTVLKQSMKSTSRSRLQLFAIASLGVAFLAALAYIYFFPAHTITYAGFEGKKSIYIKGNTFTPLGKAIKSKHYLLNDEDLLRNFFGGPPGRARLWEASSLATNSFIFILLYEIAILFAAIGCAILLEMLYFKNAKLLEVAG